MKSENDGGSRKAQSPSPSMLTPQSTAAVVTMACRDRAGGADRVGVPFTWSLLGRAPVPSPVAGLDGADRQELQAEVADLGQQAVEGRLVDHRSGERGLARLVAGHLQAVEPGRPASVQLPGDADLVVGGGLVWWPGHRVVPRRLPLSPAR